MLIEQPRKLRRDEANRSLEAVSLVLVRANDSFDLRVVELCLLGHRRRFVPRMLLSSKRSRFARVELIVLPVATMPHGAARRRAVGRRAREDQHRERSRWPSRRDERGERAQQLERSRRVSRARPADRRDVQHRVGRAFRRAGRALFARRSARLLGAGVRRAPDCSQGSRAGGQAARREARQRTADAVAVYVAADRVVTPRAAHSSSSSISPSAVRRSPSA